ncbi:DoxX family protein [Marinicella rhabdoformis]|uniref:HvfX family Cu-binding RiPP maturation protein n=1 Tax=Marinicella rhabdoformis TaxID=2580566 RepID=UPI0012AED20E|nr:DoxX family protein [Marinicella rhabdoformis]
MNTFNKLQNLAQVKMARLNSAGEWLPPLFLRLILFWEFFESGIEKYRGDNWFSHIKDNFPFPFNYIDTEISWFMATWGEMVFAVMLLIGLGTRFAAFSLIVITSVATAAVHWPADYGSLAELWQGYAISDDGFGNFKLPLLFVIMLMPLVFNGGGKFSLDYLAAKLMNANEFGRTQSDFTSKGLALAVMGLTLYFVMPVVGITLLIAGFALAIFDKLITPMG